MMIWIIDKMIMKGSCLTVRKWKYLQQVTFSCDWSVWKFRLRGEIKWRSLRSEGVGASCRWDHSSCLESFIYRAMEKPWHSQEPFRPWALVWVGPHRHFHHYQYCRFWWWLTSSFVVMFMWPSWKVIFKNCPGVWFVSFCQLPKLQSTGNNFHLSCT